MLLHPGVDLLHSLAAKPFAEGDAEGGLRTEGAEETGTVSHKPVPPSRLRMP